MLHNFLCGVLPQLAFRSLVKLIVPSRKTKGALAKPVLQRLLLDVKVNNAYIVMYTLNLCVIFYISQQSYCASF